MATSKGLTKKHSALQKEHYKTHPHRLKQNKLRKIARHIRQNVLKCARANTQQGRVIKADLKALDAYKRHGGDPKKLIMGLPLKNDHLPRGSIY